MTPLFLFLLGCSTVFLGCIEAAFSALMRLSLRLMAERGGRRDRLGPYPEELPLLIVRRDQEAVLDVLLPVFSPMARVVQPLTTLLVGIIEGRREREANGT